MSLICELNENFIQLKPMTLNTMLYYRIHEDIKWESVDDYRDPVPDADDTFATADPLKQQVEPIPTPEEVHDPSYIRWQMFDEIPERVNNIECEGYVDNNGRTLDDETSIEHLTNGESPIEICNEIEHYDENGDIYYVDYDEFYFMDRNKYDLRKITKQIRTKKFICEALIGSGKSTAIRKWISSHSTERFMVIVPTVNIATEFYTKLSDMVVNSIRL